MRPSILSPLFSRIESLPGIGPKMARAFEKLTGARVLDLIGHKPNAVIDRRHKPKISQLDSGQITQIVTLELQIGAHSPPRHKHLPYTIHCEDDTGSIDLVFFHARPQYLKQRLPSGERRIISGRLERYGKRWQIPHPDHIVSPQNSHELPDIEPVYPLTSEISRKRLLSTIKQALAILPDLPEWLDTTDIKAQNWPHWRQAIEKLHHPGPESMANPATPERRRLAYDEFLASQLALALTLNNLAPQTGRRIPPYPQAKDAILLKTGFSLTAGQKAALREIENDMNGDTRMVRLLQGDVGSGKTLVAALAMANTVATGRQALLMAPTELLARQHQETLTHLFAGSDDETTPGNACALLTGRQKARMRRQTLEALASGQVKLAVGTHALFQEGVTFHDVGLVVIDEQQRFGVDQRMRLQSLAPQADILVMTATPIPRTLTLALHGGIPVSRLDGKLPGRQPIETRVLPLRRLPDLEAGLTRQLAKHERIYWICPLIEENKTSDLVAVTTRYEALSQRFPGQVGWVHGGMKPEEKAASMQAFVSGNMAILVATTVIEVGIDVPEATTIIIEDAQRFGLAQLHQLRGRVGRGTKPGICILLYAAPLSEIARTRLKTLRESDDGFEIAEKDLLLRGSGDILGARQSGLPDFQFADFLADGDLLIKAAKEARKIVETDPDLEGERGPALRILLHLFERGTAIRRARSG